MEEYLKFVSEELDKSIPSFNFSKTLEICLKMCKKYGIDEDLEWIRKELKGYLKTDEIPPYRELMGTLYDIKKKKYIHLTKTPIEKLAPLLRREIRNPISVIVEHFNSKENNTGLFFLLTKNEYDSIKKFEGRTKMFLALAFESEQFKGILIPVRVRILEFIEKIRKEYLGSELFIKNPFIFLKDSDLKQILIEDYNEIRKCYANNCIKAGIVLAGSVIEAVLLGRLLQDEQEAKQAVLERGYKRFGKIKELAELTIKELIEIASDLRILTKLSIKVSEIIRDFRNIIHPENQVRKKYVPKKPDLELIINLLNSILRQL